VSSANSEFVSSARSVSDLKAHLVLTTKYRKPLFTDEMLTRLGNIFLDLLENSWNCRLIEFNGESNHIHLLFQYTPQMQLSKLVNNLKTVSSRYLKKEFEERFKQFYWKDALWNGSYFIASCGGVTVEQLKKYVENQKRPQ
jgi:putative transposase